MTILMTLRAHRAICGSVARKAPAIPTLLLGILVLSAGSAAANIYLVRPDGTGDFTTIQAAINAAVGGDVFELSDGTFVGDGNRDVDFGGKAVTVRF
jgi:hypothetical protein